MPNDIRIKVVVDPTAQPSPTMPDVSPSSATSPKAPLIEAKTAKLLGAAVVTYGVAKRVGAYAVGKIGDVTGNYEMQRRIQDDLNTFKKFVNPLELAKDIIEFQIDKSNFEQRASYESFVRGNLINGGR